MAGRWQGIRRAHPLILLVATPACGLLFPGPPASIPTEREPSAAEAGLAEPSEPDLAAPFEPDLAAPSSAGTLHQEQVSVTLRHGELQIRVTPLASWVTLATAPDTHERLAVLAQSYQEIFLDRTGSAVPFELFLVSLYTESSNLEFEPEDLNLVNRGLRYRPVDIQAVTPDWDTRRLLPRQTAMAVYAFATEVDLERETEFEYRDLRSREWGRILPLVQSERSRRP